MVRDMAVKSSFSDRSKPGPQNTGGESLGMPPIWFLAGAYVGVALLIAGSWFTVELSSWSLGRLVGSIVVGSLLIVAILGTAIEISSQTAMSRIERTVGTRARLFGYGVVFTLLSTSLALGLAWGASLVVASLPLAGFSTKVAAYVVSGLASIVLSTAVVMRLLALACRRSKVEGATEPTEPQVPPSETSAGGRGWEVRLDVEGKGGHH